MEIRSNKFIQKLNAYKVTPQEPWLSESNIEILKLDWNEGSKPPDFLKSLILKLIHQDKYWSWYPDYNSQKLNNIIASSLCISGMQVLSFPGSDVALETICRTFVGPDEKVLVLTPSYSNFFTFAEACGSQVIKLNLEKPYTFSLKKFVKAAAKIKPKIIYLVSPNNPCGYSISREDLKAVCKTLENSLIICDQAYVEFTPKTDVSSLIQEFSNLIITRTFSKAYSLAGIRIGYCISNHSILKEISKIRNGKNVSMLSQEIASECLRNKSWLDKRVKMINDEKNYLYEQFNLLKIKYYISDGNFVLFEPNNPKKIISGLKARGIFIRDQINATNGGLRVTINDSDSNKKFIINLKEILNQF
ncbi:histidinol-phosphate transaminase [uncultured Prochlorococcus sp.]|uniref:pyridoxal phosphate-dependent aminotransferase n=1 Tax=uncultured Prochlorococcus sp. TaxID=159733 RepID=UPI00258673A9|nr:histidinol-phosphate transaminase [uncultured Prochlorococcus sp.]